MALVADTSVRSRVAAASARLRRVRRIDRAAVFVISLGGFAVVISVFGILAFIALEALPLFRPARVHARSALFLETRLTAGDQAFRVLGVDEYRQFLFAVEPDGRVVFYPRGKGDELSRERRVGEAFGIQVPGLEPGTPIVSSSASLLGHHLAAGTADGRVALMQVRYAPRYTDGRFDGIDVTVSPDHDAVLLDPARRPVRQVAYEHRDGQAYLAGLLDDGTVAIWQGGEGGDERRAGVRVAAGQRVTHVRVGNGGVTVAATDAGRLYRWTFDAGQPELTDVSRLDDRITALEFVLGGNSVAVGTERGAVAILFRAPMPDGSEAMVCARSFAPQGSAVLGFAMSPRERSFAASHRDGSVVLRHATSGRTLGGAAGVGAAPVMVMAPKADGIYALSGGRVVPLTLENPHPEVSWRTLFGKVWYEGYPGPEYVWQSTGATDDFESKLSLVPLVFGTLKGTLYAMLFAMPLGVLGALYTSQFVHPSIRAKVKPAVEIMAALPSVVIGFLAGLYLAGVVERNLVAVFLMMGLVPAFGTAGVLLWRALPHRWARRLRPGSEIAVIIPLLLLGAWLSLQVGPAIEGRLFGGDARSWLETTLGLTYDQRNSLVVGLAMGLAVIPIVFTISEDAFTSVPSSLTAASLALGASRWQTAMRVVVPTASPGVFSAVMVGFGRAVGETMIVLMATGNTPLMDWSIFNGFRTLSANIAVEIPEAPAGGTLYRTLFLAAVLLFLMTFALNTVAEIIRQRLRDRYKAV
jgi:phosphate transport system permease protein